MLLFEYVQIACVGHFRYLSDNAHVQGSFSYISKFKTILKIIYKALIVLSSITKKGEIRPPCGFWSLNDKMIKELMSFAKCEIGKCLVTMLKLFIHQDTCYDQYDCTS
jgi:hypothetical protein